MAPTANLRNKIYRLAFPNILANLIIPLAGIADVAFLGHLKEVEALTGIGLANILFDLIFFSLAFLRMSTTGPVAQAQSDPTQTKVLGILKTQIKSALLIGFLLIAIHPFAIPFGLSLLKGGGLDKNYAETYMNIRIWGAPFSLFLFVVQGYWIGVQKPFQLLILSLLLNGLNIFFDALFIWGLSLGVAGAAYATLLSIFLTSCYSIYVLRSFLFHIFKNLFQNSTSMGSLRTLQKDLFLRTLILICTFSLFNHFHSGIGASQFAATTILMKCLLLGSYLSDGFAYALESLAGEAMGKPNRIPNQILLKETLKPIFLCLFILAFFFVFFDQSIAQALTHHKEVIDLFLNQYPFMLTALFFASTAYALDGFFLGITKGKLLRNTMLLASLLGFAPLAYLGQSFNRAEILWLGLIGFMAVRSTSLFWYFSKHHQN